MKVFQNEDCWIISDNLDDDLVLEIKTIIQENLSTLHECKEGVSTTGKNAKQYWLRDKNLDLHVKDVSFKKFEKKFTEQILKRILSAGFIDPENKSCDLIPGCTWTVIGEENSYHTMHIHGGDFDGITIVLYLEVPDSNIEGHPDNNIFMCSRVGQRNPCYNYDTPILTMNPEVGKLLIFPCWVPHGTYPQTKGIGQTFNVDFQLTPYKNKNFLKISSYN